MEAYVVHSHMHELGRTSGGGGLECFAEEADARAAFDREVELADRMSLLEVNLYKVEQHLAGEAWDEWVFDNFEIGTPPVNPIKSFIKGEYPEGGC